ncbi:hypothetical protein ACFE04_030746 [Oxalis oulophora]
MELFYLLCSTLSTFFTSLVLSLCLPFNYFLTRLLSPRAISSTSPSVSLYQGTVWHERRRPVHHSFKYSVRYALFDLDHASNVPSDHFSAHRAREIAQTNGPVFLLTIPPSVGYEQNPLSLYYCYDVQGSTQHLKKCIAEVTNTPWGERVTFVFNPDSDLVAKPLHVSPFMDMAGSWNIRATAPGDDLIVTISIQHPELGNYFSATLKAKRVSSSMVFDYALFFWLMPHQVAVWIYWHSIEKSGNSIGNWKSSVLRISFLILEALKLWWKSVPFVQHPRYSNPEYQKEALRRDQKLQCCRPVLEDDIDQHLQSEEIEHLTEYKDRCISWRDAKWPWS